MEFLRRNGIRFTKYDVDKDPEAHKRMRMINSSGTIPTALINGRKIVGFSEQRYREMLSR